MKSYYKNNSPLGALMNGIETPRTRDELVTAYRHANQVKGKHIQPSVAWQRIGTLLNRCDGSSSDPALTLGYRIERSVKGAQYYYVGVKVEAKAEVRNDEVKVEHQAAATVEPQAEVKTVAPSVNVADDGSMDTLGKMLAPAIEKYISKVDRSEVEQAVRTAIENMPARKIEVITSEDAPAVRMDRQHSSFEKVLRYLKATRRVWLVGPAGSGKTTLAENIAKALGLQFYYNGAIDTPYKLQGFIDANGHVIRPAFREAYENGGVYLFDEVDASMPAAVLAFNAAMSNGHADFPDGNVKAHPDFYCIAAANTWGGGATNDFVGRMKQDAAFVDRFVQIAIDYDEELEADICGNKQWAVMVQRMRANARKHGIKVVISPRASIFGAQSLAAGLPEYDVAETVVRKSMSNEQWTLVREGVL